MESFGLFELLKSALSQPQEGKDAPSPSPSPCSKAKEELEGAESGVPRSAAKEGTQQNAFLAFASAHDERVKRTRGKR